MKLLSLPPHFFAWHFPLGTFDNFQLNYKDHLGNNRLSYTLDSHTDQAKILEENHYYPFDLKHGSYNNTKKEVKYKEELAEKKEVKQVMPEQMKFKYKYNGKELQDELGLNVYDYGARVYDPAVPRFWQVDPLAEKYGFQSVYVYADDNPVRFMDIDGKGTEDEWIIFSTGETVRIGDKGGDEKDYVHKVDKNGNITTKVVDVKKSYVSVSGTEIPTLIDKSPGLRVYDATAPAIKENNIFFDILTGKELLNGLKYIPKLFKLSFFKSSAEVLRNIERTEPLIKSIGSASKSRMLARKLKMNINSPTTRQVLNSLDDTVESFISRFRKPSIRGKLPGEFLNQTVEDALKSGNITVRKLLTDKRFIK